jgi:hypothetical protein
MDVYLVPIGPERFELYCETADEDEAPPAEGSVGLIRRLQATFSHVLATIEREQEQWRTRAPARETPGILARARVRALRWLAERVAEQRLLWKLRGQVSVIAWYPEQLDPTQALGVIRQSLQLDADRHSRWLVIDSVGLLFSLLLTPVPGPNLAGYYFTFRVVGHFLAARGARQGLRVVKWDLRPSGALAALAGLDSLPAAERGARVRAIESELGLSRLARFFERTAVGSA